MTVAELISELNKVEPSMEVHVPSPFSIYPRRTVSVVKITVEQTNSGDPNSKLVLVVR